MHSGWGARGSEQRVLYLQRGPWPFSILRQGADSGMMCWLPKSSASSIFSGPCGPCGGGLGSRPPEEEGCSSLPSEGGEWHLNICLVRRGQPGPEPPGSEPLEQLGGGWRVNWGWHEHTLWSRKEGCERWCQWWNCSEVPWWPWRHREGPLCWFLSASAPSCWLGVHHRGNLGCSGFPLPTGEKFGQWSQREEADEVARAGDTSS